MHWAFIVLLPVYVVVCLFLILVIFIGRYAFGSAFGRYPELRQNELVVVIATALP